MANLILRNVAVCAALIIGAMAAVGVAAFVGCGHDESTIAESAVVTKAAPTPKPLDDPVVVQDAERLGKVTRSKPIAIAVTEFEDLGPSVEHAVLREAIAEMLISDLAALEGIRVYERRRVAALLDETNLATTGLIGNESKQSRVEQGSVDLMILGGLGVWEDRLTLRAELKQPGVDDPLFQFELVAPLDRFLEVEQSLVNHLSSRLDVRAAAPERSESVTRRETSKSTASTAVLAFENLSTSTRLSALEQGLAEIVQAALATVDEIRLVERERIHAVLREQQFALSALVDPSTQLRVAELVGAERFVVGSIVATGGLLRVETRLIDTQSGEIVAARSTLGSVDDFASLAEQITHQLIPDLRVESPIDLADRVRDATPARDLEALEYMQRAEDRLRMRDFAAALASYERVILLDPQNLRAQVGRVQSHKRLAQMDQVVAAAEAALAREFSPGLLQLKKSLLLDLATARFSLRQFDLGLQVLKRLEGEFPDQSTLAYCRAQRAYWRLIEGRMDELIDALDGELSIASTDAMSSDYAQMLRELHKACSTYSRVPSSQRSDRYYLTSKKVAQRSDDLLLKLLELAEGERSEPWKLFGTETYHEARYDVGYYDVSLGRDEPLLSREETADRLGRIVDVFSWIPSVRSDGNYRLASLYEKAGDTGKAADALQQVVTGFPDDYVERVPWVYGSASLKYFGASYDKMMGANAQANSLRGRATDRDDEQVLKAHLRHAHRFGLCNFTGPTTPAGLADVEADSIWPGRSALIWGGGWTAARGWDAALEPLEFDVHSARLADLTFAHLAPYDLVVLARQNYTTYTLREMLAVRSYVATGGNLLVVVSPAWYASSPLIHNPLLHFFGIQTGSALGHWAECEAVADHPALTRSQKVSAKWPCELVGDDAWSPLWEAEDRVVAAARDYGQGRILVASMAQWYVPETSWLDGVTPIAKAHGFAGRNRSEWPLEFGARAHVRELTECVAWLTSRKSKVADETMRNRLREASLDLLRAHYHIVDDAQLDAAGDRLIEAAPDAALKEEALWIAGEAAAPFIYEFEGWGRMPHFDRAMPAPGFLVGQPASRRPLQADRRPRPAPVDRYQQLVADYPDSAMAPYAHFQLADCRRRQLLGGIWHKHKAAVTDAIPAFESLQFEQDTYIWAWHRIALAQLYLVDDDITSTIAAVSPIAKRFARTPEKLLATAILAKCYERTGDARRAELLCEAIQRLPMMKWPDPEFTEAFGTHEVPDLCGRTSRYFASQVLRDLARMKRSTN